MRRSRETIVAFLSYTRLSIGQFSGLSTFQFLAFIRRAIFYTFLSIFLKSLGLGTTEVTLMATIGMISNSGSQMFLWGPLLDRFKSSKSFVIIGEVVAGIGHFVLYFVFKQYYDTGSLRTAGFVIILGLGFIEIWWSMSNVGWTTLISELTDIHERKQLMGQLSIIGGLGGIAGATLGGIIFDRGGGFVNGILFYIPAFIMILSGLLVLLVIRIESQHLPRGGEPSIPLSLIERKTLGVYLVFLLSLVLINFGRNSIAIISSLYLAEPTGVNASDVDIANFRNVSSLASMVAGLVVGGLIGHFDDFKVMLMGSVSAVSGIVILALTSEYYIVLISAFLIGSAQVIIQAASYSIVAAIVPEEYRGRLFSYYNATFFLSWGIAATVITGPISDYYISQGYAIGDAYRVSFVAAAIIVLAGILVLLYSARKTGIDLPETRERLRNNKEEGITN